MSSVRIDAFFGELREETIHKLRPSVSAAMCSSLTFVFSVCYKCCAKSTRHIPGNCSTSTRLQRGYNEVTTRLQRGYNEVTTRLQRGYNEVTTPVRCFSQLGLHLPRSTIVELHHTLPVDFFPRFIIVRYYDFSAGYPTCSDVG